MCVRLLLHVILFKPSLRPPFVNSFEKTPTSRDLSFNVSLFLVAFLISKWNRAKDRRHSHARRDRKCERCDFSSRAVLVYRERAPMPSIALLYGLFFLSALFFFSFRIEHHRKEGQRESQGRAVRHGKAIAIHYFLIFSHPSSSLSITISLSFLFSFPSCSFSLPLSFSFSLSPFLFSSHRPRKKKTERLLDER